MDTAHCLTVRAMPDDAERADIDDVMQRDLERFLQREKVMEQTAAQSRPAQSDPDRVTPFDATKAVIDKVLIADFFFICLALVWLAAGVGEKTALSSSALLDAWFPLWTVVFQPALGLLMAGALLSGAVGWFRDQQTQS